MLTSGKVGFYQGNSPTKPLNHDKLIFVTEIFRTKCCVKSLRLKFFISGVAGWGQGEPWGTEGDGTLGWRFRGHRGQRGCGTSGQGAKASWWQSIGASRATREPTWQKDSRRSGWSRGAGVQRWPSQGGWPPHGE